MVTFTEFNQSIKLYNRYSQFGEDGILEAIFEKIGVENKWCFECGATDGVFFSNTRKLIEDGWQAVLVEIDDKHFDRLLALCDPDGAAVRTELKAGERFTTPQFALWHCKATSEGETSLGAILKASYAPADIDLLVVDIDGQDYHLWNSLLDYQPRVVICEYDPNADPDFIPSIGGPGQAGERAIHHVALARGYQVVCKTWCNLICVRNDLCHLLSDESSNRLASLGGMTPATIEDRYRYARLAKGIIHVGAHEGQERHLYAHHDLPVLWIEALPDVYERLRENIAAYPKQQAIGCLVTDIDGAEYTVGISNNDGQSSSVLPLDECVKIWPGLSYTDRIDLHSRRLDTVIASQAIPLEDFDTLVLDVQGAELLVLNGAVETLKSIQYVFAEAWDYEAYAGCAKLGELDAFLKTQGFERVETFRYEGDPSIGYTYEALYSRDPLIGGYTQQELIEAKARRARSGHFMFAAAMSTPRWGPLSTMDVVQTALTQFGAPFFRSEGAYWHHQLTDAIERALRVHPDAIMAFDYDSLFCPLPNSNDIARLVTLLIENPDIDVIAPMQVMREGGSLIAMADGEMVISEPLAPVWFAHFGMTLFRASVFERLSKPWFWEKPDPNGGWGEGRVDPDSGFWLNCKENGIRVALATDVVLGHGEYGPTYPDDQFRPIRMSLNEWRKNGMRPPANAFNRQRFIEAALAGTNPIAKVHAAS